MIFKSRRPPSLGFSKMMDSEASLKNHQQITNDKKLQKVIIIVVCFILQQPTNDTILQPCVNQAGCAETTERFALTRRRLGRREEIISTPIILCRRPMICQRLPMRWKVHQDEQMA